MSTYTAIVGDCRSIGRLASQQVGYHGASAAQYLNPRLATARIRTILDPHTVTDAIGGFISADFTIPAEEALRWRPLLRYGAVVWLFDGRTPIFYGYADQPVWTATGDCMMTLTGAWGILGRSRMREAWDSQDLTLLTRGQGGGDNKAGQVTLQSDNTLMLSIPGGSTMAANDRVSVDYLVFGENAGNFDQKLLTGFEFDISDFANLGANMRVRVIGKATAFGATGDLLWDSGATSGASSIQGALNLHGTNQSGLWTSQAGYRCLRVELITLTARTPLAVDTYVTFDRIRFTTREAIFKGPASTMDSAEIARDILTYQMQNGSPTNSTDYLPLEFSRSNVIAGSSDSNTGVYAYGLDPITGTGSAPASGTGVTGFNALDWEAPSDLLAQLAAIDGSMVGFYFPYNTASGYDTAGAVNTSLAGDVGSAWLSAPPQLVFEMPADPVTSPDYTIHTLQGAVVVPNPDQQPLEDRLYVNYRTHGDRSMSVVTNDGDTRNYLSAQGFLRAGDYNIDRAIGDSSTASSLGQQQLRQRRNPVVGATITIENDGAGRYPILQQGAAIPKLATVRPGAMRIVDVQAAGNLRAGIATHVEWWGATLSQNERVQITLAAPGQFHAARHIGKIVHGDKRTRKGVFHR